MPLAGHVGALAALTRELTARGHDVTAYTGRKYAHRFDATWLPWTHATDYDDADCPPPSPGSATGKAPAAARPSASPGPPSPSPRCP